MVNNGRTALSVSSLLENARARRGLPDPDERKRLRVDAGLSLRQVAQALDVSHTAVMFWEAGQMPRGEALLGYIELLDGLQRIEAEHGGR